MRNEEDQLQADCLDWYKLQYPKCLVYSIPNAAKRSFKLATLLKRTGMVKGCPDLCFPEPRKEYHGLYIEMKAKGKVATLDQNEMLAKLRERRYKAEVCDDFEDFRKLIWEYFE